MTHNGFFSNVGNTPLVQISRQLYAKLETFNPTGSVKDRMIAYLVRRAQEREEFGEDTTFIEATSGNTGISLAAAGAALGNPVKIIMPSNMSDERKQMMRAFGAEVIEVGHSDFDGAIAERDSRMRTGLDVWSPMQFENPENVECHCNTTGPEIHTQLDPPMNWSAFVAGSGTGGTMMGMWKYRETNSFLNYRCVLVVPEEDAQSHGIQGINDGQDFLLKPDLMDGIMRVKTADAIERARRLAQENGLLVGISAGANVLAAERWIAKQRPAGVVVTILCDRGERYLSCS
jgi:cysteine synthase A